MDKSVSEPFNILFLCFMPILWRPVIADFWLLICINVTKLTFEANIQACVLPSKVLLSNACNTLLNIMLNRIRDFYPYSVRIKDPFFLWRHDLLQIYLSSFQNTSMPFWKIFLDKSIHLF